MTTPTWTQSHTQVPTIPFPVANPAPFLRPPSINKLPEYGRIPKTIIMFERSSTDGEEIIFDKVITNKAPTEIIRSPSTPQKIYIPEADKISRSHYATSASMFHKKLPSIPGITCPACLKKGRCKDCVKSKNLDEFFGSLFAETDEE